MHRVVAQLKRRLKTQGQEQRGRKRHAHVDVRKTMRASLETGGVPVELKYRPTRPRRPEIYVLCDVSTSVTSASVFFLCVLHALHDSFRKMRSFVFIERISEVTDVFERERDFKAVSEAIGKDAGVADISGYTDYGRVWTEFRELVEDELHPRATVIVLGDARTNGRDPRADVFAHDRRARRAHVLAEPRAAAVLELRRLGHRGLRGALRGLRVLDDAAARGLRQGAGASAARLGPVPGAATVGSPLPMGHHEFCRPVSVEEVRPQDRWTVGGPDPAPATPLASEDGRPLVARPSAAVGGAPPAGAPVPALRR